MISFIATDLGRMKPDGPSPSPQSHVNYYRFAAVYTRFGRSVSAICLMWKFTKKYPHKRYRGKNTHILQLE